MTEKTQPELSHDKMMEILYQELGLDPISYDEWDIIDAIRQNRALLTANEAVMVRLEADRAKLVEALSAISAESYAALNDYFKSKGWKLPDGSDYTWQKLVGEIAWNVLEEGEGGHEQTAKM
jgi:hypothetical protein